MKLGTLFPFQVSAVERALEQLREKPGILLTAHTGYGKTFIFGEIASRLLAAPDCAWFRSNPLYLAAGTKVLYVTAASVVPKTRRDLKTYFGLASPDVEVISYSLLSSRKSKTAKLYWSEILLDKNGAVTDNPLEAVDWLPVWHQFTSPRVIIFDECHKGRHVSSAQSKVMRAAASLQHSPTGTRFFCTSATPFVSVLEAGYFAQLGNILDITTTGRSWESVCHAIIGHNANPLSQASGERFRSYLQKEGYLVTVPHIRTKYKSSVNVKLINFSTLESKQRYNRAFADYQEECKKLGRHSASGPMMRLVALMKFRERAEVERYDYLAHSAKLKVSEGYQHLIACDFQSTIAKTVSTLVKKHGIPRSQISIIWGGNEMFEPLERTFTPQEIFKIMTDALDGHGDESLVSQVLKQVKQTSRGIIGDLDDPDLQLGAQSQDERDAEIDKFNSGQARVCLFTFKAGSVGLSLHHTEEYYITRPERYTRADGTWFDKKLQSLVPIQFLPSPRTMDIAPTWSAIEFLQAQGRPHRINSMSDTRLDVIFFAGTVEESVAVTLGGKLGSIKSLSGASESWTHLLDQQVFERGVVRDGFDSQTIASLTEDEHSEGDLDDDNE